MPNTRKFMLKMIDDYNSGRLNERQVCASIRRITTLNERQWSFDYNKIANKIAAYIKEEYSPSNDTVLEEVEEDYMCNLLLNRIHDYFGNAGYKKLLDLFSNREPHNVQCAVGKKLYSMLQQGEFGEDLAVYFKDRRKQWETKNNT